MPRRARSDSEPAVLLDDTLEFMQALWALDHGLQTVSKALRRRIGLTGPQRLVLRIVHKNARITAGALARALHLHPSTLTGVLSRLESQRLIERRSDAADARRALFVVTSRGAQLLERRAGTVEEAVAQLLEQEPSGRIAAARVIVEELAALLGKISTPR